MHQGEYRGAKFLDFREHVLHSSVGTVRRYRAATQHLEDFVTKQPKPPQSHQVKPEAFAAYLRTIEVAPNGHNRTGAKWLRKIEADADKLKRLGWKWSAALLVVVAASRGDVVTEWPDYPAGCAVWNQPALAEPFVIALPGGGTVVVKVFDIKRDPAHTLAGSIRASRW